MDERIDKRVGTVPQNKTQDGGAARPHASQERPQASPEWTKETSVGYLLNVAARSARGYLDQLLAEAGATFVTWTVLANLATEGNLIQRELADRLSIESPTLTRHLSNMEAAGLIERLRSESDRRAAQVKMTPRGRKLFARLESIVVEGTAAALQGFTRAETETLFIMLMRIENNIETARATPRFPG